MIITMTTVGYGDFYTRSTFARWIIIFTGFYGILVTSLLVFAFTNLFTMQGNEIDAFTIIKSILAQDKKNLAAIMLTSNVLKRGL